jgi:glutathione S-transferase
MVILKLYGLPRAICTQRVAVVLHELKVPYELVEVSLMTGEHKRPEYLAKQPFGQIPYIVRPLLFLAFRTSSWCGME